jgi:D-3-phosphoglycerate dehydrogenase
MEVLGMNSRFKVLDVSRDLDTESMEMLKDIAEVRIAPDFLSETIQKESQDVDAIIIASQGLVDEKVLKKAPRLQVVGRIGTGYQNVDIETATKLHIPVVYSGTANSDSVADLTFGLLLNVARNISLSDHALKTTLDDEWNFKTGTKFLGTDVWNKALGIIGFGRIGKCMAKRAKGFDMRVLVYDPHIEEKKIAEFEAVCVDLQELLRDSDFVTIHTPLTEKTKNLIGKREIEMMKDGAYLINAAYGGIVDEEALYKALLSGKLGGAALDTPKGKIGELGFNPKKPLYNLKNVVVTPMLGARTKECSPRSIKVVVEGIMQVLKGEKPTWTHNPL